MNTRILISLYYSFIAVIAAVVIFILLESGSSNTNTLKLETGSVTFFITVAIAAFPWGYVLSSKITNSGVAKSTLLGIGLSFLSIISFVAIWGVINAFTIPIAEALLGAFALVFFISLFFGVVIFPIGALGGLLLFYILKYHKTLLTIRST